MSQNTFKIYKIEDENRLFFRVLSSMMVLYCFVIASVAGLRNTSRSGVLIKTNRFTRLIVDLPVRPTKVSKRVTDDAARAPKKETKEMKKEPKKEKIPVKTEKKLKKIRAKKKAVKNLSSKETASAKKDKDIANLGVLQVLGAEDSSDGGIELLSENDVVSFDDITEEDNTDNLKELLKIEETSSFLEDAEASENDSDEIVRELDKEYKQSNTALVNLKKSNALPDVPIVKEKEADDIFREPEFIEKRVKEYAEGIRFCYNKRLAGLTDKGPRGRIVINFTILASGDTEGIEIDSKDIADARLKACITNVVARWKFPASAVERILVTYPLLLTMDKG